MNFIEELRWRGMIHNEEGLIPGTEAFFATQKTAGYIGFDPTGDSLHIGNLATIMMLVHLQRAGHTPIALVGGATGMVGDPSGKDAERQLLSLEQLRHNQEGIRKQLAHFLDFEGVPNPAKMVNNYDWFGEIKFLEFLRDVGKHITISYMMAKESVKKRLETGISYTEFAYQLLQGYDFMWLYENEGVRVQMGGADQWGNITTGTELIRRKLGSEERAFAITCPLITREDGSKFGKSADGQSVWLSAEKTSPYQFYQYWINVGDNDAEKYIKVFTLKGQEEIEQLVAAHQEAPHLRGLQQALAEDVTKRVHGEAGLQEAKALTNFFFARKLNPEVLEALSPEMWQAVASSSPDTLAMDKEKFGEEGLSIVDLLTDLGVTKSKGEARRSIEKDRSISVNGTSCTETSTMITARDAFHGRYLLVQRGKKNKYLVQLN
ncbi:MAG: tyrosine--tRNA ligase [Bacteroidota bacterium]